jgi:ribosomal protein S18 acetylase RimI-like enzyme
VDLTIDRRVQAHLRAAARRARAVEQVGPFLASFDHDSDNPFLNYAIPDDHAEPTPDDVAALISAYRARNLRPRLEYCPAAATAVEPALVAGGFVAERRVPLMVCRPEDLVSPPPPDGVELLVPSTADERLGLLQVQHEAYDDPHEVGPADADRLGRALAAGSLAVLARVTATGEPIGAGTCPAPDGGLSEVAGIAVRERFRRRGVAAAVTARLTQELFAGGGDVAFLTPEGPPEERIYTRLGYARHSEVLHISVPDPSDRPESGETG